MQTNSNKPALEELRKVIAKPHGKRQASAGSVRVTKSYHHSAAYAATMWHSAVNYVKPHSHGGINP